MQQQNKEASVLISEDYQVINETAHRSHTTAAQRWLANACGLFILSCLLILPFLFGGVHEYSFLSFRFLCFLLITLIAILDYSRLQRSLDPQMVRGKIFIALSAVLLMLCLHSLFFWALRIPHPVLESVSALLMPSSALDFVLEFANFVSVYAICCYWLSAETTALGEKNSRLLSSTILLSAFLVSLTALSHWFYDNGKLFWVFPANTEATSNRARWPFVNPNHLGIFLILPLFMAVGKIEQALLELGFTTRQLQRRGKIILSDLINHEKAQKISRSLVVLSLFILTSGLALIASLSRNAIAATFVFLLLYLLLPKAKKVKPVAYRSPNSDEIVNSEVGPDGVIRRRVRRKSSRSHSKNENSLDISKAIPTLRRVWRLVLILSGIGVLWFFLGEKGGELFKSRLEYALIYTQDDMRWQLYRDSIPMLLESPLLGIGIGNWSALYPRFMAEGLSGMNPGYLHSDFLQTIIETGLIGAIFFCASTIYCFMLLVKKVPLRSSEHSDPVEKQAINSEHSKSVIFGFMAMLACACFEFPLRIPAITSLLSIIFALEAFRKDKAL